MNTQNNTHSKEQIDLLTQENENLKNEIKNLRQQIDLMQDRSTKLQDQNRELREQITTISEHENELLELQKQKDELFALIIHDIKNPAGLIKNLVELLTNYDLNATEQQDVIKDIVETSSKIVSLSQEVSRVMALEGSRLILNIDPFNINLIASDIHRINESAARSKDMNFILDLDENIKEAEVDAQKVSEIIDNLVSNAIKFTHVGGTVRLRTRERNGGIVLEVSDNGQGLSEEDIKHAFQRGAKLSARPTQGESSSGLGLWIIKKLVDAHNGRVWIKSALGKGSTFAVSLPYKQNDNAGKNK